MAALSHLDEDAGGSLPLNLAMGHGGRVRRSDAPISFPVHRRFISIAALGGMLAFSASAQTVSSFKLQAPPHPVPNPKPQAPPHPVPIPQLQATPQRAPRPSPSHQVPLAPIRRSRRLIRAPETIQPPKAAAPEILIMVSKPTQSMTVTVDGRVRYRWRVSTGATYYSNSGRFLTPRFVWS